MSKHIRKWGPLTFLLQYLRVLNGTLRPRLVMILFLYIYSGQRLCNAIKTDDRQAVAREGKQYGRCAVLHADCAAVLETDSAVAGAAAVGASGYAAAEGEASVVTGRELEAAVAVHVAVG